MHARSFQLTQIDEARRRLHARLHSAGHALDVAMARIGLGGECLKPTKGYHFQEGPYVEYEGEMPPQYAADLEALMAALNAEMKVLVEEGVDTNVHVLPKANAGELLPGGPEELAHLPDDKGTGHDEDRQKRFESHKSTHPHPPTFMTHDPTTHTFHKQTCASWRWPAGPAPVAAPTCGTPRSWGRWR